MDDLQMAQCCPSLFDGPIQINSSLSLKDRIGGCLVRWNIGRYSYKVEPGLYKIGSPDNNSDILVTANYKLTFDKLRKKLSEQNLWILVLDTKGINVWCAAGKGTFGTEELVQRISFVGLKKYVSHRRLILPQLGAPGVSAHNVLKQSGFKVTYGPIRADDIKEYFSNGKKVSQKMRRVEFSWLDRLVLSPVELMSSLKYVVSILLLLTLIGGFGKNIFQIDRAIFVGSSVLYTMLAGWLGGCLLTPLLLPFLPGRTFAVKGAAAGFLMLLLSYLLTNSEIGYLGLSGLWIIALVISSFCGMNFTGSSTYTSLSGVKKEMKYAVPIQIVLSIAGLILWVTSIFVRG